MIAVLNKADLLPSQPECGVGTLPISAKTGEGLDALKAALVSFARENFGATEAPLITRARHRQEIERARAALASFLASAEASDHPELAAEHLREAADALGQADRQARCGGCARPDLLRVLHREMNGRCHFSTASR